MRELGIYFHFDTLATLCYQDLQETFKIDAHVINSKHCKMK